MKKRVVLVFDANQRSALAVTRSIGQISDAYVICCDTSIQALAGTSRFCDLYLQCPAANSQPVEFIEWVASVINKHDIELLMPVTEVSSRLLLANKDKLPKVRLPFPALQTVLDISDKTTLMKSAERLGVAIPQTRYYQAASEVNVTEHEFPCVIKPSLSRIYKGERWIDTKVMVAENQQDLQQKLSEHTFLHDDSFMIQEFIDGHGEGVFCFYDNGQAKAFFAHERLREKPPEGGVSVLSRSALVDAKLKQQAEILLDDVKWQGVAMIEYRIDQHGQPFLMEINARFWGSLQLAIDAGVDFPNLVFCSEFDREYQPFAQYCENIQLRWFLGDLDSLYLFLRSSSNSTTEKLKRILAFITPCFGSRHYEINRLSDMKPAWFEIKQYIRAFFT